MLTVLGRSRRVCNGVTRRQLLEVGGAGLFGLSLPTILAAEAAQPDRKSRAKSVMFLYLFGGPSQLETFDMKPDARSTVRGPFQPITARTPGLRICEYLLTWKKVNKFHYSNCCLNSISRNRPLDIRRVRL